MSGGVDSCATAIIMKNKGLDCVGATMRLHSQSGSDGCVSERDINDAKTACDTLNIEHRVLDFSSDFDKYVIEAFISAYENGATPNPCIECNFYLKFDKLLEYAAKNGFDSIATGHYAILEYDEKYKRRVLKKARDLSKDQSYVLYRISRDKIDNIEFPLGTITSKAEVRELASLCGASLADKKESQDICFVPDGDYAGFIEKYRNKKYPPGNFVTLDGRVLGQHKGIIRYTIGQRKGLGLALDHSMYVCDKRLLTNEVVIGENEDLYKKELWADCVNLLALDDIPTPIRVKAKIRYKQEERDALAEMVNGRLHVVFDEPQRAICIGQSVVLYDGDVVVGGGIICDSK